MVGIESGRPIPEDIDTYGQFLADLHTQDLVVLPDAQIQEKIALIRNPETSEQSQIQARSEIISATLRLIPYVIKEHGPHGIPPEEHIAEAYVALDKCIDNYDPDDENASSFGNYAHDSLVYAVSHPRSYIDPKIPFSLPRNAQTYAAAMRRSYEVFIQKGTEPSIEEWHEATEARLRELRKNYQGTSLPTAEAVKLHAIDRSMVSLGKTVTGGDINVQDGSLKEGPIDEEIIDEDEATDVVKQVMQNLMIEDVETLINSLPERERLVMKMRYGIGYDRSYTQDEIGEVLGRTGGRIHQIEKAVLRHLRHPRRSSRLRDYLEE